MEQYCEEDGEPSSLSEGIRRLARALGVTHLRLEGNTSRRSVLLSEDVEPVPLREITCLCDDWKGRLARFAQEIRDEQAAEKAEKARKAEEIARESAAPADVAA